jgi:hypothetical protein
MEVLETMIGFLGVCNDKGENHLIDFFDGRHIVTHNLWYQGEIPDHFLSRLPDNARWGIKT